MRLLGFGGYARTLELFFCGKFPEAVLGKGYNINCLEMLTVIVALKLWGSVLKGQHVQIFCDNSTTVTVINSSRTRSGLLAACLRELAFLCATFEMEKRALHISTNNNRWADWLSRAFDTPSNVNKFLGHVDFWATEVKVAND